MQSDELIEQVRLRGGYTSAEETRRTITEVLIVLGSRELGGEAENLAAQLPAPFGDLLRQDKHTSETFDETEFIRRVQTQLGLSKEGAQTATRSVLSTMIGAVSDGEQSKFVNALPRDLTGYITRP